MFKWILNPNEFDYSEFNARWTLSFKKDKNITNKLKAIPQLITAVETSLSEKYDEHVAKIYFEKLYSRSVPTE